MDGQLHGGWEARLYAAHTVEHGPCSPQIRPLPAGDKRVTETDPPGSGVALKLGKETPRAAENSTDAASWQVP